MGIIKRVLIMSALLVGILAVLVLKRSDVAHSEPPGSVPAPDVSATSTAVVADAVSTSALPRLVDLGAGKCVACKAMTPILEALGRDLAGICDVEFIDVWKQEDAAEAYGIRLIPTQIFYDAEGHELFRHEGFFGREEILAKWAEFGVTLPAVEEE